MKYLLKKNNEDKGVLCDKVVIDGFDYYLTGISYVDKGDFFYNVFNKKIEKSKNNQQAYWIDKVIATNNPNIDIPKVVDVVEAEAMSYLDRKYSLSYERTTWQRLHEKTYAAGFSKSQETHPFSEDDMIAFAEWVGLSGRNLFDKTSLIDAEDFDETKLPDYNVWAMYGQESVTTKKLLQTWEQNHKIKTIYYEQEGHEGTVRD